MNRVIEIEREFDALIPFIDGKKVCDLVGLSPSFDNADYIFESDKIVMELKCLEENKLVDKNIQQKLYSLLGRWKKEGHNINLTHDGWKATVRDLPPELSKQILKIYAKPIRKRIVKANKQIKETKKALSCLDYQGVLLLANDGNLAIDPEHVYSILNYVLGQNYSGINAVIFFTVNQLGRASFTNVDTAIWANLNRDGFTPINDSFFNKLSNGWMLHLEQVLDTMIPMFQLSEEEDFKKIVNANTDLA